MLMQSFNDCESQGYDKSNKNETPADLECPVLGAILCLQNTTRWVGQSGHLFTNAQRDLMIRRWL